MRFSEFRQYRPQPNQNVFVFVCEDDLLLEESREIWRDAFGGDWAFEKLAAKEFENIPASRLMDDALTPSLFSQSRAYIVTGEKFTKDRLETLAELHSVARSSLKVILVVTTAKELPAWSKPFPVVAIDPVRPPDAARWLIDRYKFTPDVARSLVDTLGPGLRQLHTEAEKLVTYTGGKRPVDVRDIDVLILRTEQYGRFELGDAIMAKNYPRAVQVLNAMLDDGTEALPILGMIVRVWRQLFIGKALAGKKGAPEVAQAAGFFPAFRANDFVANCRKHDRRRLAAGFNELLNADKAFKMSTDAGVYFDVLLWKLIG